MTQVPMDAPSPQATDPGQAATEAAHQASVDTSSDTKTDPLLACLEFLTQFYQTPHSAAVLRAGLPLVEGNITPSLFVRAAARAGLVGRVVSRPLKNISNLELPVVAILDGDQACVVVERHATKGKKADVVSVMMPEAGGGVQEVALAELVDRFAGYVIYARPEYHFDVALESAGDDRPRRWFWGVMARNWAVYGHVALAAVFVNLFALATPLFIMTVYDRVVPNNATDTLIVLAIGVGLVYVFEFAVKSLRGYYIDVAGKRADVALASAIFDHVLDIQMASRPASAGGFANTLREFETVREFFASATLATLVDLPFIALFIVVIWMIGGSIAIVPAIAVPVVIVVGLLIQIPLNRVVRAGFGQAEVKHGVLFETIGGLETIKSLGAAARMRQMWETSVGQSARYGAKAKYLSLLALNFSSVVQQFASVGIVIIGVFLIASGGLTIGALIACVILNGRAVGSLSQVAQLLVRWHQARISLHALDTVMKLPVERPGDRHFLHRPKLDGKLQFKGVTFSYPDQVTPTLEGVSFTIQPGERVGLIGRVGSGKSTVQKLILGLYEPQQGTILVDGTELRQIDPVDLRRGIGAVPQDVFLFRGTVRENITVGAPHANDQQVLDAARIAGVDDFVSGHPMGYDLPVGERGEGLSGGQRQAIALARAMLGNPAFLLLDEPTNSMDNAAEAALKDNLGEVLEGRTLILVTHRTSLLSLVDRLMVIDKGKIVAEGPTQAVLDAVADGRVNVAGD